MSSRYSLGSVLAAMASIALVLGWCWRQLPLDAQRVAPGTFELTVERIYETHHDVVVRLQIAAAEPSYRQVWSPAVPDTWIAGPEQTPSQLWADARRTGEIWIFGSSFMVGRDRVIKIVFGGDGSVRYTRPRQESDPRLIISAQNGTYPTGKPIRIGRVDGQPVYLAVGEFQRLIDLRETTVTQPVVANHSPRRAPCYRLRSV